MIKDNFFDRKLYLDILEKRIRDLKDGYRQNIAIIGDELIGKTSIIFKFLNKFYDNRIIIIYLEIRPEALASFTKRFIATLLYNFLINSGIPLQEDIDFLIKRSQSFIPKTVEKIKLILNALDKRKKDNIFSELLSLCETIKQEADKSCVVIFDEFHNLRNLGIKNLYTHWSKLLILQKNTMYIIISSMEFKAKNILSKNLSLLFGNFEILTVEPFDVKTSEEYIGNVLGGMSLDEALRNFIVHFTGGYPFYLEVIIKALLKSNEVNLVDALEELFYSPSGILNQRFSNYLKHFQDNPSGRDYIAILYQISNGRNKFKDIAHILHKTKKEMGLRLNHLMELGAIKRSGDFLAINDRVFSFWLKFVYQEKLRSLTFDAGNQKTLFRNSVEAMIEEFIISAKTPVKERITELLRLFEDDLIQIERKKIRLNHFREIKPLEFNSRNLKEGLICRSKDSLWIMVFKYEGVSEEDITEFARECKKYRYKLQRKIIITFQDIDANTRLRAMEEKILTWDLNRLNQILDLYSKPRVIV